MDFVLAMVIMRRLLSVAGCLSVAVAGGGDRSHSAISISMSVPVSDSVSDSDSISVAGVWRRFLVVSRRDH